MKPRFLSVGDLGNWVKKVKGLSKKEIKPTQTQTTVWRLPEGKGVRGSRRG